MLAIAQRFIDIGLIILIAGVAAALVKVADRWVVTRELLDRIDPGRVHARHPSNPPKPKPTGTVRLLDRPFDFERDA